MNVVVDTNVLVSGLLNPFGDPGKIVQMVLSGTLFPLYDARVLAEYRDVLFRPEFPFRTHQVRQLLDQIQARGELVAPQSLPRPLPHRDDEMFLEAALAGPAEYLITHNLRHFPTRKRAGMAVVSPAEFLDKYRQSR